MDKPSIDFIEFPKIARLSREIVITEKIDGTNAQIFIDDTVQGIHYPASPEHFKMHAGSRTKWITPEDDNYGFARWVEANKDELMKLGPGSQFGEWWGKGIQRGYGVPDKRFSLFNTSLWGPGGKNESMKPSCCGVVPVLYKGPFDTGQINMTLHDLQLKGSVAAPGFMKPEGIVIFHTAQGHLFKKTIEKDEQPKGLKNG